MTGHRVVFVWPDQSRTTEGSGRYSAEQARRLAATVMAPVGHLRPEWVEIFPGRLERTRGEDVWTDYGGPVDAGPVNGFGRVEWEGPHGRRTFSPRGAVGASTGSERGGSDRSVPTPLSLGLALDVPAPADERPEPTEVAELEAKAETPPPGPPGGIEPEFGAALQLFPEVA